MEKQYDGVITMSYKKTKKEKRKSAIKRVFTTFSFVAFISILIFVICYLSFVGLIVKEKTTYTQTLNLEFSESQDYEWMPEHAGSLQSVKISGLIENGGKVKIYLDNLLILDSSNLAGMKLTGEAIANISEEEEEAETEESEEEIEEPTELSIETQEQEKSEEEKSTINKTQKQQTEEKPAETEKTDTAIKQFEDVCEQTCDLPAGLNKSSYSIKIEMEDVKLKLNKIKYKIVSKEEEQVITNPEDIEANITKPEVNIITNITTKQYKAVIGKPVKWTKNIQLEKQGTVKINLPKQAENITVSKIIGEFQEKTQEEAEGPSQQEIASSEIKNITKKLKQKAEFSVTAKIIAERGKTQEKSILKTTLNFFKKIFLTITGRTITIEEKAEEIEVTIEDNATEYEIEYETPAPQAFEEEIIKGKRIIISAPDELHYEDVLAYTELPIESTAEKIHLYYLVNETRQKIQFIGFDNNNNGLIDYIEWEVPLLSNKTYELIVEFDAKKSKYKVTSECSYETCHETEAGREECTAVFGECNWINDNGVFKEFTDVADVSFEHDSGNLTYSYKKDYSVVSRLFFVLDVPKEACEAQGWDWRTQDNSCFLWPDNAKEFMKVEGIEYDIVIAKNPGSYKYALNLSGIPQNYQDKLLYVGLHLEEAKGLTWNDVKKEEKTGKSLVIKNKIHLSFNDLLENGFTFQIYDKRTVLIGNVKNKENLWLDPMSSIAGETSDGDIYGKDDDYDIARSTSTGHGTSYISFDIGQFFDGSDYYVYRAYLDFNTSSLDDSATVSDVKLSLNVSIDHSGADFNISIYNFKWAEPISTGNRESNYDASGAVYDNLWRSTDGLSEEIYYNSSSLNNAWINLTGDTKYQLRSDRDVNSITPSGGEYVSIYSGDSTGKPILYVTYTVAPVSQSNITLSQGWNMIAMSMNNTDVGTDRNISIVNGWNLIGFSSNVSINLSDVRFINSSGSNVNWSTAVSQGKVQAYLIYRENNVYKYVSTPDLNMHDYALREKKGYWLYANQPGNLTLSGVGGSISGQTFNYVGLRFHNGTSEKNASDAGAAGWIFSTAPANRINYFDENGVYRLVCESILSCNKITLSPWEGYFIWSNKNNIIMIRQN